MVAQLGQPENYSVCSEMHEVWVVEVVCNANATASYWKLSSLRVPNLVSRLVVHDVPGGCARWRLGRFVSVNHQHAVYEPTVSYLTRWTKKSPELEYIYPFFLPSPPFSFPPVLYTASILNYLDIMWLAHNNAFHSKTHLKTYTTFYFPFALPSTTCNCIIMLTHRM